MSEEYEELKDIGPVGKGRTFEIKSGLDEIYYSLMGVDFDLSVGLTDVDKTVRFCMDKIVEESEEKKKRQKAAGQLYQVLGALLADADDVDPEKAEIALDLMLWLAGEVEEPGWDGKLLPWSN